MVQSTVSPAETVRNHPDTEKAAPTPTPWNVRDHTTSTGGRHIWVEGGRPIGETRAGPYKRQILEDEDYDEKAADAALIVKAVNSHDDLVKALTQIRNRSIATTSDTEGELRRQMAHIDAITRDALAKANGA